ncbi:MAG: LptF/LptG family permease [Chitinophagaceae bacterium]
MFKKLDILVIKAFIGPFFATFTIAVFVFTLQFFWLYLDDMVGKGLNFWILMKLIGLVVVHWVPLALPLSMLLSGIMTFGNLGETFEIVAIKSAGISLLRFMRPLVIATCFISLIAFIFLNNIIPVAELKLESLKHDIILKQPAFDIKEGVFYNKLRGFVIKIGKKEKDDSTIKNVVIFEGNNTVQDNLITAESGVMRITKDKKFLEFVLYNGCRYQEKGIRGSAQNDYIRMGFKQYSKLLDMSSLQMGNGNEQSLEHHPKMLTIRQIDYTIDSVKKTNLLLKKRFVSDLNPIFKFAKYADSGWLKKDTFKFINVTSFNKLIPDSLKKEIYQNSIAKVNIAIGTISTTFTDYKNRTESLRVNEIEWHKRFTYSLACLILFLIGAPLGSIIRKGGLGTPLVFAIIFFAIFYLLNTFGEKFSKEYVLSSFAGIWLSTFVLVPIAVFLIYKALQDSQLFNNEFYFRLFRQIKAFTATFKKVKTTNEKVNI